jgi:hypothetical protein
MGAVLVGIVQGFLNTQIAVWSKHWYDNRFDPFYDMLSTTAYQAGFCLMATVGYIVIFVLHTPKGEMKLVDDGIGHSSSR